MTILLGVNIDHVATLRQARGTVYPDPIQAALIVESAGADSITVHLREDRRHIQDVDVQLLKDLIKVPMNLEMAVTDEMLAFAEKIRPKHVCLVPERREELTTEGGLDVIRRRDRIWQASQRLAQAGIEVSLFIDPEIAQIEAAIHCQVPAIEIHTGAYADAHTAQSQADEFRKIQLAAVFAKQKGLIVNAGHGLNYNNVQSIAEIPELTVLNIGHSIIAHAIFTGLKTAVHEMKELILISRDTAKSV